MPKRKRPEEEFLADLRPLKRRLTWREAIERVYQEYPKGSGLERNVLANGLKSIYSVGKLETKVKEDMIDGVCRDYVGDPSQTLHKRGKEYFLLDNSNEDDLFPEEEVDEDGNYIDEDFTPQKNLLEACVYVLMKSKEESLISREIYDEIKNYEKSGEISLNKRIKKSHYVSERMSNSFRHEYTYFGKYRLKRRKITRKKVKELKQKYGKKFKEYHIAITKHEYFLEKINDKEEENTRKRRRRRKKKEKPKQETSVKKEIKEERENEEIESSIIQDDDDFDFSTIKIKKEEYDEDEDDDIEEKDDEARRLASSQPLPFFDDEDE